MVTNTTLPVMHQIFLRFDEPNIEKYTNVWSPSGSIPGTVVMKQSTVFISSDFVTEVITTISYIINY